jgi:hypothetical protein
MVGKEIGNSGFEIGGMVGKEIGDWGLGIGDF